MNLSALPLIGHAGLIKKSLVAMQQDL